MIKSFLLRVLRFVGVLVVIYISMVFYLALTERRNAFPRAISHTEANQAIAGKTRNISCTLEDGTILWGWVMGNMKTPTVLYYPDAEEDAAQFLAEADTNSSITFVAFNYRGSGDNKGTPSQETFESDAKHIAECASQINPDGVKFFAGRGTGAILAAKQQRKGAKYILIDPVFSIADAISSKYRALYPKFLIRANVEVDTTRQKEIDPSSFILYDRAKFEARTEQNTTSFVSAPRVFRKGGILRSTIHQIVIAPTSEKTNSTVPGEKAIPEEP